MRSRRLILAKRLSFSVLLVSIVGLLGLFLWTNLVSSSLLDPEKDSALPEQEIYLMMDDAERVREKLTQDAGLLGGQFISCKIEPEVCGGNTSGYYLVAPKAYVRDLSGLDDKNMLKYTEWYTSADHMKYLDNQNGLTHTRVVFHPLIWPQNVAPWIWALMGLLGFLLLVSIGGCIWVMARWEMETHQGEGAKT